MIMFRRPIILSILAIIAYSSLGLAQQQTPEATYQKALNLWWEQDDLVTAYEIYQQLLGRILPGNKMLAPLYFDSMQISEQLGQYRSAAQHASKFLELHSNKDQYSEKARQTLGTWEKYSGKISVDRSRLARSNPPEAFTNSIDMHMLFVPGGRFLMGTANAPDAPAHEVCLAPFYISEYEVTAGQFGQFMDETKYSYGHYGYSAINNHARTPNHPATFISYEAAKLFTIWLSAREDSIYRLPSEAEWEFAARGTDGRLNPWGNEPAVSGIHGNLGRFIRVLAMGKLATLEPVGSFPNGRSFYGLSDMAGNVSEWCLDRFDPSFYKLSPKHHPTGPNAKNKTMEHVIRGFSWRDSIKENIAVTRSSLDMTLYYDNIGFRVVREIASAQVICQ